MSAIIDGISSFVTHARVPSTTTVVLAFHGSRALIARSEATKQSRICLRLLDCFASLAMTKSFIPDPVVYDSHVMPGLEPGIQTLAFGVWMAGSSPAITIVALFETRN
jgi:hypothetical protein